jgi:hypothetical protein
VVEIKGVDVPEDQQKDADGKERLDGFKVVYFPCDDCKCKSDRIKMVQARDTPGYPVGFDSGGQQPYIGKDKKIVVPEYPGWKGPDPYSFLDGPYNRLSPKGTFNSEVCAVCRDGQKVLGCVSFSFDMGTRRLTVPGADRMTPDLLGQFGNPGQHGESAGAAGYMKGCSNPGKLWGKAMKAWEAKLPR